MVWQHPQEVTKTPCVPVPECIRAPVGRVQDVRFLGWQETLSRRVYPLYTILSAGHPLDKSTVSEKTLRENHFRVPRTPSPYPGVTPSPWHDLGTELDDPLTASEAVGFAGLDYTVVRKPMEGFVDRDTAADVSGRWVTTRTDTGDVLGIVGEGYEPVQNRDAFSFFDTLVADGTASYETAGIIGRGERMWILAKLPGFMSVNEDDHVNKYLLLSNSHDDCGSVRVKLTPVRVVCNNTLTAALQGAGEVHVRHTADGPENVKKALAVLALSTRLFDELDAVFNRMALTKVTDGQLLEYVKALVPDDGTGVDGAAAGRTREAVLNLYESGQGANLSRGTLWGAFNCVTEYTDHLMEADPSTRLESIWFGRGEELKLKAFRLAWRMM
jgi:phage/plasmid-like protein (TIGR03299 family)